MRTMIAEGHTFCVPRPGERLLDLGCHAGGFAGTWKRLGGRVATMVEPQEELSELCRTSFPEAEVLTTGVGTGMADVVMSRTGAKTSARIQKNPRGKLMLIPLVELLTSVRPSCVKMDVEGAEWSALDALLCGGRPWPRPKQWTIEFHDFRYPWMWLRTCMILEHMCEFGYDVIVSRNFHSDVLLVRGI